MIDFKNATFLKLKLMNNSEFEKVITPMLINGESIISSYKTVRDGVVFTNKRIISINV